MGSIPTLGQYENVHIYLILMYQAHVKYSIPILDWYVKKGNTNTTLVGIQHPPLRNYQVTHLITWRPIKHKKPYTIA